MPWKPWNYLALTQPSATSWFSFRLFNQQSYAILLKKRLCTLLLLSGAELHSSRQMQNTVLVFVCFQQPTPIKLKTYKEKWSPCKECGGGSWVSPNANEESQLWHAVWSLCVLVGAYSYVCMCATMFFFFCASGGRIKQLFLHIISSPVQSHLPDNFIPASPSCLSP